MSCFGGRWYSAQIWVRDPYQSFGHDVGASETNVIMGLVAVTVATCVVMPIRLHVLWVLPTCSTCMLCAAIYITSTQYPGNLLIRFFFLSCVNGFSVFAGFRNESHLRKEWLAQRTIEKQISISEKQKHAFNHLLDRLCDCLVHLGPNLTIMEPCPRLAAMLFLPSGRAFLGSHFCDCISAKEDQDRFCIAMSQGTSDADPAGILSLHLKDSQNQEVQVHIYYTAFNDQDDSRCHIIGIVEAGARTDIEQPLHQISALEGHVALLGKLGSHSGSSSESDLYSECADSVVLESVASSDLGEAAIVFKDNDSLSIISCTTGFTRLCGAIGSDAQFSHWIQNQEAFLAYIQNVGNHFVSIPRFEESLILAPPSAARAGIAYAIESCTLNAVNDAGELDHLSQSQLTIRMSFNGIRQLRLHRKRNVRASSPRMSPPRKQLTSI